MIRAHIDFEGDLNPQELEVLGVLAEGLNEREISAAALAGEKVVPSAGNEPEKPSRPIEGSARAGRGSGQAGRDAGTGA